MNVVLKDGKMNTNVAGDYNLKVGGSYNLDVRENYTETINNNKTSNTKEAVLHTGGSFKIKSNRIDLNE